MKYLSRTGNLHFNVLIKKQKKLSRKSICRSVNKIVFDNVKIYGGAISAEHGIGRLKTNDLIKYSDPIKLKFNKGFTFK